MTSRMRRFTTTAALAACAVLALPALAGAREIRPRATTGAATHILGSSALLTASIDPEGVETSYYFQYGTTAAYGVQTPTLSAGAGTAKLKVGQAIGGLQPGATYHFRVVAVNVNGAAVAGKDHLFKAKGAALSFVIKHLQQDVYGTPFVLSGALTGFGNGGHRVALQASPFPFLEPFTEIGIPGITNAAGAFSFRVANLVSDTQFRVSTLDPLPVYSPVVTVSVIPRVSLHVHTSSQRGVVRLYGTITPAVNGAKVSFQVLKAVRPGKNEITERWTGQFSTVAKRNTGNTSRFSVVATVRHGGRYRAYVKPPAGNRLSAGPGTTTVVLHSVRRGTTHGK
ncbi:MAG TPA: hypothetical protein VFW29_00655 [Solirubrobacteraceae bacterium]|nr:hypothetical protein [Solirubrobacteraceae bacterium]